MSIFNLSETNARLKPIQPQDFPNPKDWERSFQIRAGISPERSKCGLTQFDYLKHDPTLKNYPLYYVDHLKRISCLLLSIVAGLLLILAAGFQFLRSGAPAAMLQNILPAILIPASLLIGACFVLYRLAKKTDIFAGTQINPFQKRILAPMHVINGTVSVVDPHHLSYVDLSTLDAKGSGIALAYNLPKDTCIQTTMTAMVMLALPFVTLLRMTYNIIRFLVVPFYIIFKMLQQHYCSREALKAEEMFTCGDILREATRSLCSCLKAPFYSMAYLTALLYSLLDPLDGRITAACIERAWNDDVIRSRSYWVLTKQRFFEFEGGGSRFGLGQHGYYLMGCAQPHTLLLFENGEIVSAAGPTTQFLKKTKGIRLPAIKMTSSCAQ